MESGLLIVNKPQGVTSRWIVDRLKPLVRPAKIGHAGTLDPLATGVLVVGVGAATRLLQYVQQMPKCYVGRFLLGRRSPTEDTEGPVVLLDAPPVPVRADVLQAAAALTGPIMQRPPAYSAIKQQGRRAYDLARRGEEVKLAERPVTVYGLEVTAYEYPQLTLAITCSSGTYVRSLGRDLARRLGTEAVMSALVRTAIGDFGLSEALDVDRLGDWARHLLPPLRAIPPGMPRVNLSAMEASMVRRGQAIATDPSWLAPNAPEIAAVDCRGQLLAILGRRAPDRFGPVCNLPDTSP